MLTFDVHAAQGSAIAAEALERIAALYAIEKEARGQPPDRRAAIRRARAGPRLDEFERWLQSQLPKISAKTPLAAAIRHALTRMKRLRPYLEHGFLEIDNNPAERAMRPIALGRKNYLFMGSASGGKAAAIAYTLIETARLNDVNPQAWLAQVLERIPDCKINRVDDPLHYLSLLEKKPGALDQAAPLRGWKLDPAFDALRRLLEARFGPRGKRDYIQTLRLLEDFPERQVTAAVRDAVARRLVGFDAVKHLLLARIEKRPARLDLTRYPHLPQPFVAATRAGDYASLLAGGAAHG